jgi:hypothetical protein
MDGLYEQCNATPACAMRPAKDHHGKQIAAAASTETSLGNYYLELVSHHAAVDLSDS